MKIKYALILLVSASLLLSQCKKEEITGCKDSNAFNYDADADIGCCCEYLIKFDAEGTGGTYDVTWKNVSGSISTLSNINNSWGVEYVATVGASVSFTVTNKNTDTTTTAVANIWNGNLIMYTQTVTGTGATASVSGLVK